MPEQRPALDRYRSLVADHMLAALGLSQALQGTSAKPATAEQCAAIETLRSSARQLQQDLAGLRTVVQGPAETKEISALLEEALMPLRDVARHGIRLELSLPPLAVRVRAGWLAASEAIRILARRVLDHVYEGGTLRIQGRLSGNRMIVEMAHEGGTLTAAPPETHPNPSDDPRFRRVKALLAGIGAAFALKRQPEGGLSAEVALEVAGSSLASFVH